jgi:hypothetical protein
MPRPNGWSIQDYRYTPFQASRGPQCIARGLAVQRKVIYC